MMKPILCLDFDGVCHSYTSGWKGADVISDPPVPGLTAFIAEALEHFDVCIYSSRSHQPGGIHAMEMWLWQHTTADIAERVRFPAEKPPALVTIDDRAMTFQGEWPTIEEIANFKPWNRQKENN